MTKIECERKEACDQAKCRSINKCAVHWGKDCNRQGGKKIPRFRQILETVAEGYE